MHGEQITKNLRCTQHREIAGKGALDLSSGEMTTPAKGHLPPPGVTLAGGNRVI